ncbi:hypothetical protein OIU77_016640 [Salix suchowensis]|uniref:Ankyrin repeat domain-containing protein EMB506, chloroplastic n=1 Tax=Salix suchowensis TaxID=1278906 RepID=A0ABQ8ZL05_9ROSI|nr:hypothetical protein OIU77_016640 [Salix suchowensis]
MAFAGVTVTCHSSYVLPRFSSLNHSYISLLSSGRFPLFIAKKYLRVSAYSDGSKRASSSTFLETKHGVWEDPDDGSGSDYDQEDEEEAKENDLGFESNWKEENNSISATSTVTNSTTENTYMEDLVKEVEQLLGPEERAIFQQNASPNLRKISTAKWNPLQTLALSGQIKFMDKLLDDGFDIDDKDNDGLTALHKAIIGKKEAVISHLLRKGASPHIRDRDGASSLHYAVQVGAMQTVKLLLKYEVDVNATDNEGWTPLHIAVQTRNRDIAKILLVNGADKTRRTKDGMTPLDMSFCYGKDFRSFDIAKLLKILNGFVHLAFTSFIGVQNSSVLSNNERSLVNRVTCTVKANLWVK